MSDWELRDKLIDYYKGEVVVDKYEMNDAKERVQYYVDLLRNRLPKYFGDPLLCGSVWEGLKTENCQEFDVDFPLLLDAYAWGYEPMLDEYGDSNGSYVCYLRDRYCDGYNSKIFRKFGIQETNGRRPQGILDPCRVKNDFKMEIERMLKEDSYRNSQMSCRIKPHCQSTPAVTLLINNFDDPDYVISVDVVPALKIGYEEEEEGDEVIVLAPKCKLGSWRRSFTSEETRLMSFIDTDDFGCRKKVLRIVKTVASRTEPLSHLDTYVFKNIVMNLADTGDWRQNNMAACFCRVLRYLERCCHNGLLHRHFERERNLLAIYSVNIRKDIAYFLQEIRKTGDYLSLLGD